MVELEGLEFQIQTSSDGAITHLKNLTEALTALRSASTNQRGLSNTVSKLRELSSAFTGVSDKFASLSNLSTALSNLSNAKVSATLGKNIASVISSAKGLDDATVERLERFSDAIGNLSGGGGRVNIPKLDIQPTEGVNTQTSTQAMATEQSVTGLGSAMDETAQSSLTFGERMRSAASSLVELFRSSSKAGQGIRTLAKYTIGLPITLGSNLASRVKESVASLGHLFSAIKRIALYRLIRSVIREITQGLKEGINNIYAYSNALGGEFAAAMDSLASSSLYLKNSLGAMAAPILQSLIPAINFAIERLVALMNVINMFVAALGGKATATLAKKVETSFGGVGAAAGGAAGAAKKALDDLKTYTLGIDELNIIDPTDKNGSGGGGSGGGVGGLNPADMFETVDIDAGISSFANQIRKAFQNKDWHQLGTILGNKFNEIVDDIPWGKLGTKIGKGLNGVIETSYSALKTADFENLGLRVSELFNNAIGEVNWREAGGLLVLNFTKAIDFLIGFIKGTNFTEVGKSISDFLVGAYNEMTDWLERQDWYELGSIVMNKIGDLLAGIQWDQLFIAMVNYATESFKAKGNFLLGLLFPKKDEIDWKKAGEKLFGNVKDGFDKKATNNKPKFFVELKNDAENWWNNLKGWWDEKVKSPVQSFKTNLKNDSFSWWSNLKRWFGEKSTTPAGSFKVDIVNNVRELWDKLKGWWVALNPILGIGFSLKQDGESLWDKLKSGFESKQHPLTVSVGLKLPVITGAINTGLNGGLGASINWNRQGSTTVWGAKGGILDQATLIGAGEAGKEALLPLDQNTEWMDTIATKVRDSISGYTLDTSGAVERILARLDVIEAQLAGIGADTKRQADKPENTYVSIGSKTLRDAVSRQSKADGYSFA